MKVSVIGSVFDWISCSLYAWLGVAAYILGWSKSLFGFFKWGYRKTLVNFLANPIFAKGLDISLSLLKIIHVVWPNSRFLKVLKCRRKHKIWKVWKGLYTGNVQKCTCKLTSSHVGSLLSGVRSLQKCIHVIKEVSRHNPGLSPNNSMHLLGSRKKLCSLRSYLSASCLDCHHPLDQHFSKNGFPQGQIPQNGISWDLI